MAELNTVARPYTKAAFEYAMETGTLEQWSSMLILAAAAAEDENMAPLLSNPALTDEQKADLMVGICSEADEAGKNFLRLLAENKRLALLPEVKAQFAKLKASQEKSLDVEVITAFALQNEQQEKLVQALKTKLGYDVTLTSQVDKSILGGVVVRTDNLVIDGSIRARLAKLAEAMNS